MGEGYECDRCGSLHSGSPHSSLMLGSGEPRYNNVGHREHYEGKEIFNTHLDLCGGCRNDLRKWWTDGGGDASEVAAQERVE